MGLFFIVLMTCAINGSSLLLAQLLYSIADIITLFSVA